MSLKNNEESEFQTREVRGKAAYRKEGTRYGCALKNKTKQKRQCTRHLFLRLIYQ